MAKFQALAPENQMWARDIEARLQKLEVSASNVKTLTDGTNARLSSTAATVNDLDQTVTFLSNQFYTAEGSPGMLTTIEVNPVTGDLPTTWLPYDPDADAAVTFTTSSSGNVLFQAGGYLRVYSLNYTYTTGFIGVEILDESMSVVQAPSQGDGNYTEVWGENNLLILANSGHYHQRSLSPHTTYTFRCRRGYSVGMGAPGGVSAISFQGTGLSVSLLGL